ncbi:SRPBCC family protein [Rhodococcus sp. 2H158]|nr:hypothetical protein GQ85_02615 [Rhodococcus rhodochrous]
MTSWHTLAATDDTFFDTAPVRATYAITVPGSPSQLWRSLVADDAVQAWSPVVTAVQWDHTTPRGVGTIRNVTLLGSTTIKERFYRWDHERRMTFSATEINRPLCRAFAEDYLLEEDGTGTRFTWRAAMNPVLPALVHKPTGSGLTLALAHLTKGLIRRSLTEHHAGRTP